jgi:hypothetical protein
MSSCGTITLSQPDSELLAASPRLPKEKDGGPVFAEPSEAKLLEASLGDQKAGGQGGDMRTTCRPNGMPQFNAFVLGQLSVPIYQGGGEYSLIRQAKETLGPK